MSTNIPPSSLDELQVPEEFYKIISDFTGDILITFPEYAGIIGRWWGKTTAEENESVFRHCLKVFPERFFDILYKNVEIFQPESEINTEFLPGIVFKMLWSYDISDSTRETIWKYLQLILFAVIGSVHSTSALGETAKLFEAINEDELKSKLEETMASMSNLFDFSNKDTKDESESNEGSSSNGEKEKPEFNMPNAEDIHAHINEMMGGKLGKLAMELAEETANDLNIDMENVTNANDIFQKLFKNPGKMMGMVKNIGGKIDEKIKSGELKESELMSEGMDLLNKMQSMPGMDNMQKMFSQMGLGGKGGKFNMGAMEAQMNKNMNAAKMKERMKAKVNARQQPKGPKVSPSNASSNNALSEEELIKIFSTGEKVEKTPRGAKPPLTQVPIITQVTATTGVGVETEQKDVKVKDKKKKKK